MPESFIRIIAVAALTALAWLCLNSIETWVARIPGTGLLAEFPVVLPVVSVFVLLSAVSRLHEGLKARQSG